MSPNDPMEHFVKKLSYRLSPEARDRVLRKACGAMDEMETPAPTSGRPRIWRITMNTKTGKLALAAAAILIVLGGVTLWPSGDPKTGQWWLGPPAAWGQEILTSLDSIEAIVYRQWYGYSSDYEPAGMSQNYEIRFNAKDRYRRDRYDDGVNVMNVQWVIPDGNGVTMTEVSHQYECYFTRENEAYGFVEDFMEHLRFYVNLLDKADRLLETEVFDGRECVGFEISTARYGDNPEGWFNRIWFDVETKLPMRIERHRGNSGIDASRTRITIHDQFEYFAEVPTDLFVPAIPEGYVNAHPDDIRAARNAEAKSEMILADVPEGLKEKVIVALKHIETGAFRKGGTRVCFSRSIWREDVFSNDAVLQTKWHVTGGGLPDAPFEPNDEFVSEETKVDFRNRSFAIIENRSRHPMSRILFVAGLIDRADRCHPSAEIDGVECYGFEISAKKYGDNPDGMIHRLWFDAETDLPIRMEFEMVSQSSGQTVIQTRDRFDWNPVLPDDFFTPQIPPDFTSATD